MRRIGWISAAAALLAALAAGLAVATASRATTGAVSSAGVVNITTVLGYQNGRAAGTGIVLTPSGLVLTNNHVIRNATTIRVAPSGSSRSYSATVVGYDLGADVALLQLQNASGLKTARFGNSAGVRVGDRVSALGNAGGAGGSPIPATGHVTALNRQILASDETGDAERLTGLIQIDAPLQPGDSGGPLLNARGEVVGVDTAASTGFFFDQGTNVGYAVPINRALTIAKALRTGRPSATGHVGPTPFLGVSVSPPGPYDVAGSGAVVTGVVPGSPAERAGLGSGDVITSLDGSAVTDPDRLTALLLHEAPGNAIRVAWIDGATGTRHQATATLVPGPPH